MVQSNIIYFPDKVQEELIDVLDELVDYSITNYKEVIVEATEYTLDGMNISERAANHIFTQVFWWTIFCYPMKPTGRKIYQTFLKSHREDWKKRNMTVQQVLASWLDLSPGFYYIEEDQSRTGKVFVFRDIFDRKRKIVAVHGRKDRKPVKGEVVSVMLLPMEDGSFISQGRIIHIPQAQSESIAFKISHYYEKNAISPSYSLNSDLYPELLRITMEALEG